MLALRTCLITLVVLAALFAPATAYALSASTSIEFALTSGTPIAGTDLQFTVTANNEGPDPAAITVVTFNVPTNSTFVSHSAPGGWSCATPMFGGTGTITCSIGAFAPGSASFVLTVATLSTSPRGTPVTITGSITSTTPDPDPGDNTNSLTVSLVWQSNLAVTKNGTASAFAGTELVYTIAINNPGPSPSADLVVTDTFAAPLRFVSVTAPGWTCATPAVGASGTATCTNPQIPTGVTNLTLRLDTSPSTAPTSVTNDASVDASTDPAGPRLASATTQITTSADLTITKSSAPTTPVAGQTLTYTLTVTQNGPSDASTVEVTDPLPSALQFQSITAPGWTCTTPAVGSSGTVSCIRTPLAPGVHTITIQGFVPASTPAGATISNTASVTSATPDPTLPNTATASGTVSTQADLSIAITDSPDPVAPGGNLTYQVVVTNGGPSNGVNPSMSVLLDAVLRFASVTSPAGWTCASPALGASGTVSCSAAALASGSNAGFTIVASVPVAVFPPGDVVISTSATTSSSTTDPNPANNSASTTTTILGSAAIPTLSDLAFVLMAATLALVAMLKLRSVRSRRT